MNCRFFRKNYMQLLDPLEQDPKRAELAAHGESCPECAKFYDEMIRTFQALQPLRITASPQFKEKVMKKVQAMESQETYQVDAKSYGMRFWKPALAGGLLALAALWVLFFNIPTKSGTSAYALEQTVEANRSIRSIHLKCEPAGQGIEDLWAEFDESGNLLHLRMNFPSTEDGPKDVIWQEGKAEVYMPAKHCIAVLREENMLKRLKMSADSMDPRLIVEGLYEKQAKGDVQIEMKQPLVPYEPITLTMTRPTAPGVKEVYQFDPNTKLVLQIEKNGGIIKYLDYNQPIDPALFAFNPPPDVMRVDQTTQEIGLEKGDLTDREIAIKVVREFFEALIAGDYAKAGRLLEGVPADKVREEFGKVTFIRIVSIGEPTPLPQNGGGALQVPCEIEVEKEGVKAIQKFHPGVRQVYNQPDRWDIFGYI